MWCKACGQELGDPKKELHDPEGEFIEDIGVIENPDDHHIRAVYGEKGMRLQCSNSGQMTKLVEEPPDSTENKGSPSGTPNKSKVSKEGPVYDLKEEKSQLQVLESVVSNPAYELSDSQIKEVLDWGDIYDGGMPPGELEKVLKNLSGVSNQKAKLVRNKYEARMNKFMRNKFKDEGGPPIGGAVNPDDMPSAPSPKPQQRQPPSPNRGDESEQQQERRRREESSSVRDKRRNRRVKRRQDAIDVVAEEAARNMADDIGRAYSDVREILTTVLRRKAEKDPDWFLEKADQFGMDIIEELSEPSDAKKEQMKKGEQKAQADREVEQALEDVMNDESSPQPQPPSEEPENNKSPPPDQPQENPMKAAPEEESEQVNESPPKEDDSEEAFQEIMGDVEE